MRLLNNVVLVIKSESSSQKQVNYVEVLKHEGVDARFVQVLDFKFTNLECLKENLVNKVDNYSGIIFTSPRAIMAANKALSNEKVDSRWRELDNYVIGETTKQLAHDLIGLDCNGSETGNAVNLAQLILKDKLKYSKPFLVPCGNLKRDVLSATLKKDNVHCDCVTVYETVKNPQLDELFRQTTNDLTEIPKIWVYFSPSGVQFSESIRLLCPMKDILIISIGPATTEELNKINLSPSATLAKPSVEHLLTEVQALLDHNLPKDLPKQELRNSKD